MARTPTARDATQVERLLETYDVERKKIGIFMTNLLSALREDEELAKHVHSFGSRLKDREHLKAKLFRKIARARETGAHFDITPENLLERINDLAGVRILHLYTRQIRDIDEALRAALDEQQYSLREEPFARTWDDESRGFFESCGIRTEQSPTMYTSVHYVVGSASRTLVTCEIQVRTLMEEVWGEVDHSINYPEPIEIVACREQLKVLARLASSGTRLVDSIFTTLEDAQSRGGSSSARSSRTASSRRGAKVQTRKPRSAKK